MFKHTSIIVIVCIAVTAFLAQQAYGANSPSLMPITATFERPPACVVAGSNAKFPLRVTNLGSKTEEVTVELTYVTPLAYADAYSVVIAEGTDHLLGIRGAVYWRFRLAPGQSVVKYLVTRIQPQFENKRSPATYAVTEFISVAGIDGARLDPTATAGYCDV